MMKISGSALRSWLNEVKCFVSSSLMHQLYASYHFVMSLREQQHYITVHETVEKSSHQLISLQLKADDVTQVRQNYFLHIVSHEHRVVFLREILYTYQAFFSRFCVLMCACAVLLLALCCCFRLCIKLSTTHIQQNDVYKIAFTPKNVRRGEIAFWRWNTEVRERKTMFFSWTASRKICHETRKQVDFTHKH